MDALKKIEELMAQRNWSRYELAKRSGISQSTLASLFSKYNSPTIPTLESICKGFGISMSEFFAEEETEHHLTAEQIMLLQKWSELSGEQKNILWKFLNSL